MDFKPTDKMKSLLVLYCLTGLFGYYLMYHTSLPDVVKWDIYFVIYKVMRIFLIVSLFFPTKSTKALKWIVLIAAALDIASEFDQIKQQGNYVEVLSHAFGVVMFAGVAWAVGEQRFKSIAAWFRLRPKS